MSSKKRNERTGLEIAVVGIAGRFPGAKNTEQFWDNLKNGVESVTFFTDNELAEAGIEKNLLSNPNYVKAKGTLDQIEYFDAAFFGYSPKDAQMLDPQIRIFSESVWEALEDAGYDPYTYKGLIGLYAGSSPNYYWESMAFSTSSMDSAGQFDQIQMFDRFMTTRISYKLNLKGPSFFVFTACSTSLVAVHLACRALLTGECNIALAGGVSLSLPQKSGYYYQEGMIMSPDGHCRAFDAEAKGTVWGEGAGVVVLKMLKNAITDGDHIYAVIKGTAINNDGSRKVGYTAPSVEGQADVIRTAQRIARVDPESISYIETHGTGTTLGDPIEIEALKTAFHTEKKQFCRIGSVKSNLGHLDIAAGIASFIKTVLAMQHKQIPPSLHFQNPNPKMDMENSPFMVNTELIDWNHGSYPLRAGVSAFGVGGTNVHVILEEAQQLEKTERQRPSELILISGKTETALEKATINLVEYLMQNPTVNLSDMAYTLSIGRAHFPYRKIAVCSDRDNAVSVLKDRLETMTAPEQRPPITFMFPGQGSQYLNMGRELYETEPEFRDTINNCSEILKPLINLDLKTVLYPEDTESNSRQIYETAIAQPVIFSVEYGMAKLLMKWGIKPKQMIGHSIGEYVAACLAGVFSLEDALSLVAWRGKLMQEMDEGAMLSISLTEVELTPLLTNDLSIAAINSPSMCVVSGPIQAVANLEERLKKQKIYSVRLQVSHAFHSIMMEPMLHMFLKQISQIKLLPPQIPYLSNVTGDWIIEEEALNPEYWVKHLRNTVRFSDGAAKILETGRTILIEVGGGRTLSTLVRSHSGFHPQEHTVLNSMRHPKEVVTDTHQLLTLLGQLWLQGVDIDWEEFYAHGKRQRISLPKYPFERNRFWIDGKPLRLQESATRNVAEPILKKNNIREWFYVPTWKKKALTTGTKSPASPCLIFLGDDLLSADLIKRLQKDQVSLIIVKQGQGFMELETDVYTVDSRKASDYETLFNKLNSKNRFPEKVIHLWSISEKVVATTKKEVDQLQLTGFYSLLYLAQAIGKVSSHRSLQIFAISNHTQVVTGGETIVAGKATILGACKVIPQEFINITCKHIDVTLPEPGSSVKSTLLDNLENELFTNATERVIAYRDTERWVEVYQAVSPNCFKNTENISKNPPALLKQNGVYLITGGLGNIGMQFAHSLATNLKAKLVLIGRSPIPERSEWEEWLTTHKPEEITCQKITRLKELEALGAEVLFFSSDLSSFELLEKIVLQVEEKFGLINGIIHAAGKMDLNTIDEITKTDCETYFQAKIYGLLNLVKVFENREIDFCLLMSSLAATLGGFGLAAYSAANLFLDAFVQQLNKEARVKGHWFSVNWDGWMFDNEAAVNALGGELNSLAMTPEEGVKIFYDILALGDIQRLTISTGDLKARVDKWLKLDETIRLNNIGSATDAFFERPNLVEPYVAPRNDIEVKLAEIWREILRIDKVGINDNFFDLGGHSINALQIIEKARQANINISVTELFASNTIAQLTVTINQNNVPESINQAVEGEVDLIPVQLCFLERRFKEQHHWNASFMILNREGFNTSILSQVLLKIVEHHDALRMVFSQVNGRLIQYNRSLDEALFDLKVIDLTNEVDPVSSIAIEAEKIQNSIDLEKGPLVKVGIFRTVDGDHLLLAIHHLICDGDSLRIILEDLMNGYMQVLSGNKIKFPKKTSSIKEWAKYLHTYGSSDEILAELDYWQKIEQTVIKPLPKDYTTSDNRFKYSKIVSASLPEIETERLLHRMPYDLRVQEALLITFGLTIKEWTGEDNALVRVINNGRDMTPDHINLSRTVGWLSISYPVILDMSLANNLNKQIQYSRDMLRSVPSNGAGYDILRYITLPQKEKITQFKAMPELIFNFLGIMEMKKGIDIATLEISTMPMGFIKSPESQKEYTIDFTANILSGKLVINIDYNYLMYNESTMKNLAESYLQNLKKILQVKEK